MENVLQSKVSDQECYKDMINSAPDAFFLCDSSGNFIFINPAAVELTGYSRKELLSMNMKNLFSAKTMKTIPLRFEQLLRGHKVKLVRPLQKKNGSSLCVEMHSKLMPNGAIESIFRNIDDLSKKESQIEFLLAEKSILLKEVHHRIKNNMITMSSLFSLQVGESRDAHIKEVFEDAICRINTMQKVYEKLYISTDYESVNIAEYLTEVAGEVCEVLGCSGKTELALNIEDLRLHNSMVFPLGIIINELITNSAKYAFKDRCDGKIELSLEKMDSLIKIRYHDNGMGITGKKSSKGFGMTLIKVLSQQLQGILSIDAKNGFTLKLEFPC